jgi:hydrogenase maturation factor
MLMLLVIGTACTGAGVYAHHSFAVDYFEDQTVSIEGEVEEFQLKNPHSFLYVKVKDERGELQTYAAEWGGLTRLERRGVTADTLKPGDYVIVTGSPGRRAAERRIHLKGLHRPSDGWRWPQAQRSSQ